jgi:hypothetical protein
LRRQTATGFGSTVVKAMAESSLDGDVDLDFVPRAALARRVSFGEGAGKTGARCVSVAVEQVKS